MDYLFLLPYFYMPRLDNSSAIIGLFSCAENRKQCLILEITWGIIRGTFGSSPWLDDTGDDLVRGREGRQLGESKGTRLWPGARVPYEFADTIDFNEWSIMQRIFSNISSVTNIQFVPRLVCSQ